MWVDRSNPTVFEWTRRNFGILRGQDPVAIRGLLATESTLSYLVFLQLYVSTDLDDAALLARWKRGALALADLERYAWGAAPKRTKFAALVADPEILVALQGAVARGSDVTMQMLGVLALDGSAESIDALVPHLDPALQAADARLERLRTYATTPAMRAIVGEVDDRLAQRAALSPALALAPAIGLGELPVLWFHIQFNMTQGLVHYGPVTFGSIVIDSRREAWFTVSVHRRALRTSFTHDTVHADQLGIGRCEPTGIPRWIAASAQKLDVLLDIGSPQTNLRGKKREQFMSWLRGG